MQQHTSYMHLMTIKKARLGRQSIMARVKLFTNIICPEWPDVNGGNYGNDL